MSKDSLQKTCKQRFKGVENFLRRVAFNLGNTPSQTEVKIISCIPIDVTDLQQKIINLEKQLCEVQELENKTKCINTEKVDVKKQKSSVVVNTALNNTPFAKQSSTISFCTKNNINQHPVSIHCEHFYTKRKKSNTSSYVCPAPSTEAEVPQSSNTGRSKGYHKYYQSANLAAQRYKNIFCKRKKKKTTGKGKLKTQLVYYAQTPNIPFNLHQNTRKNLDSTEVLCLSHLDNVVKRQYDPNIGVEEFSDTSFSSRPICRDTDRSIKRSAIDSDICSCCHGQFQNIDNYMTTNHNYDIFNVLPNARESLENTKIYYNSKDYDLIPVKDYSNKTFKENINRNETNKDVVKKSWPEKCLTKYRYHPFIVNYQTEIPINRRHQRPKKLLEINEQQQGYRYNRHNKSVPYRDTTKNCSIECSNVYQKQPIQNIQICGSHPVKVTQKDKIISTDDVPQGQSTDFNQGRNISTESTLDQIKTMLQNVLAEVKTTAKLNNATNEKFTKDVIVQKGSSQNNMPGVSTLLHSFTYKNSYNINPYLPSCSRQIPQEYCFAGVPFQPVKLSNFPVLLHPASKKRVCACYCKNNYYKHISTGTNTDRDVEQSSCKETEKLIKEIYKSVALNLDLTTKENSLSEYDNVKSANDSTNASMKEVRSATLGSKRDVEIDAILTPLETNTNYSKSTYTTTTQLDENKQKSKLHSSVANKEIYTNFYRLHRDSKIVNDDDESDESGEETESDETVIFDGNGQSKKGKKGFLKGLFKSVKLFHKKKDQNREQSRFKEQVSDSDDYETIYSYQSSSPRNGRRNRKKSTDYSEIPTSRENGRNRKRPYLEQEYRRQWNENLTFHKNKNKVCDGKYSQRENLRPGPYWKNYEARSVIIESNIRNKKNSISKTCDQHAAFQNCAKPKDKLSWLRKQKIGKKCGEQWKNFILEN